MKLSKSKMINWPKGLANSVENLRTNLSRSLRPVSHLNTSKALKNSYQMHINKSKCTKAFSKTLKQSKYPLSPWIKLTCCRIRLKWKIKPLTNYRNNWNSYVTLKTNSRSNFKFLKTKKSRKMCNNFKTKLKHSRIN